MRLLKLSLLILTLSAASLPASGSSWFPLDTGRIWVYSNPTGVPLTGTAESGEMFAGSLVQPLRWSDGACSYYSLDRAGHVYFHGVALADGKYAVWDPPVLCMDDEIGVGHEWETNYVYVLYTADGKEIGRAEGRSLYQVIDLGPVEVAAGTFQAAEVLLTEQLSQVTEKGLPPTALLANPASPGDPEAGRSVYRVRQTFAEGLGLIRQTEEDGISVLLELTAYGVGWVPLETSSWGGLKARFKN